MFLKVVFLRMQYGEKSGDVFFGKLFIFRSTWVVKLNPQLGRKKEIDEIDNFFFSSQLGIYSINHMNGRV